MAASTPIKTYSLVNNDSITARRLELQQNGQPILWVNKDVPFMGRPTIKIQSQSENGPILAATRLMAMSGGVRVLFVEGEKGAINLDATPKEEWYNVIPSGFTYKEYEFRLGPGRYVWRRTRDSGLGASSLGGADFKLLDISNGDNKAEQKVLAVYIKTRKFLNYHDVGRMDFMVELGMPLELMSLAAILGIEEKIRRKRRSNNAAVAAAA